MPKTQQSRPKPLRDSPCPFSVSVIIPNYNYASFLPERFSSILSQTYPISELIILDDASTDNSTELIEAQLSEIRHTHPELKTTFLKNQKNSGGRIFSQWLKGLAEVKTDLFWIAEADDSASPNFLATAVQKFSANPNTVLFFSDSCRINESGKILSRTCSDWADMWKSGRYRHDFVNTGEDEVKNYLSGTNPILNVSSVVWKNLPELPKIFAEAKTYKVAGDWYIYSRILEYGDIAYSAKPLNFYRKHNQGSASSVINSNIEYGEVVKVQDRIISKYNPDPDRVAWAKTRRRGMGFLENEENKGEKGTLAWLIPSFTAASGGHRTIFSTINYLIEHGYRCDAYIEGESGETARDIYSRLIKTYGAFKADVLPGYTLAPKDYNAVIATGWNTAAVAASSNNKHKIYFIQDYEPYFFPQGWERISAEQTYSFGLQGVAIGRWLTQKLSSSSVAYYPFCADLDIYRPVASRPKEDAICCIFQPGKPRRCHALALRALQIVQKIRPETKIYLYGSAKRKIKGLNVEHLGTISPAQCNNLYNTCSVGLCLSASNPSRIPFEMMASGLPVVELGLNNTIYDLPEGACLLAEPTPEAVATALLKLLGSSSLRERMSQAGQSFMSNYPILRAHEECLGLIEKIIFDNPLQSNKNLSPLYRSSPITASLDVKLASKKLPNPPSFSRIPNLATLTGRGAEQVIHKTQKITKNVIRSTYRKLHR